MDTVGDFITRIRNGQSAGFRSVECPFSKLRENIVKVLCDEGYVEKYVVEDVRKGIKKMVVFLKYFQGAPVIKKIVRVSKPGRRVYSSASVERYYSGMGTVVLSTPQGIKPDYLARREGMGGEVLLKVF